MSKYALLVPLLAFALGIPARPQASDVATRTDVRRSLPVSETYNDTVRLLKDWLDTPENDQMATLFAIGDLRMADLLAACHGEDEEIAGVAFLTIQLLGGPTEDACSALIQKRSTLILPSAQNLTESDFQRIKTWLAQKRDHTGYKCGNEEDAPLIDDALVYALTLDDSKNSVLALKHLLAFEKACEGSETLVAETLKDARSLTAEDRARAHNLKIDPGTIESTIRASAFFLPSEYRQQSSVELLARNSKDDRILLEVSYRCGMLCGRGYYVVLRKAGTVWEYAVIRMIWIS